MADRKISALTELTAPVADDVIQIIDSSESSNSAKNKKIQYTTLLRNLPSGSNTTPSLGWLADSGATGLYRSAANTLSVSINQTLVGSFQSSGLQLGAGTPAAQLHLFSTDTTDQIILENSDAGADTAPDLVLYRNSASPANADNLGNLVYRGEDSGGNAHDYASIAASIKTVTNGGEDGILDLMSSASGTLASRIRLSADKVGFNETVPLYPVHITVAGAGTALWVECSANDAGSTADITLFSRRGASGAGQDNDILSTIFCRGKNDAGTPEQIDYSAIESKIIDASDGTEDGQINFKVMDAGTLTTQFSIDADLLTVGDAVNIATNTSTGTKIGTATGQKIGFWNVTPVDQPAAVADLAHSTSSGTLPTPDGTVNISNAASPTNAELLTYCVELEAKLEAALARLRETGLIAT
tara:strand:+ start:5054 stop:6298 length:1245 start_codon:yes stop_codon:yes gene_type:complete